MKKPSGFTLIAVLIVIVATALFMSLLLIQIHANTREAELSKALGVFGKIRRATHQYLRSQGPLRTDLWTSNTNPCNPHSPPGRLSWSDLRLEDPRTLDENWYYALYIGTDRAFSIGAISKDCSSRFFEAVHPGGKTEWVCDSNAGMRPVKEKDGTTTGCTYW